MRMTEEYTIPLSRIIKELSLREVHMPKTAEEILIVSRDVIRPGLELYGFCDYFDPARITILGRSEMAMLNAWGEERKAQAVESFFSLGPLFSPENHPCHWPILLKIEGSNRKIHSISVFPIVFFGRLIYN